MTTSIEKSKKNDRANHGGKSDGERKARLDPRFVRPSKKSSKVVVDKRFEDMFKGDEFVRPLQVDKYGRSLEADSEKDALKRFYRLDEDEDLEDEDKAEGKMSLAVSGTGSDSDTSSDDSDDDTTEEQQAYMDEALSAHPLVATDVNFCDATRRLALVNMDWDQIRAEDIYTLLYGFKPVAGEIHSVVIYPSKFGKERMERESLEGPPRELFNDAASNVAASDDDGDEYDEPALRKYQLERLRYYYAVIECDSPQTAYSIYKNCDGSEFEKSANFLDLRFIPEETVFSVEEDGIPKDACTELPKNYRAKPDLVTSALQMSKVSLTWDGDDVDRERTLKQSGPSSKGKFDPEEADLRAYLASSSDESDNEDDKKVDEDTIMKYRRLLQDGASNGDVFGKKGDKSKLEISFASALGKESKLTAESSGESDVDQEATFTVDGSEQDSDSEEQVSYSELTPFHKMLERKKQRKEAIKKMREESKAKAESIKKTSKSEKQKVKKISKEEAAAIEGEKSRLSLLIGDNDDQSKSRAKYDEDEEDRELSRKRSKKIKASKEEENDFVDINDPRFAAIYEEPSFALDPSSSSFKKSAATRKIIEERQRRLKNKN